MKIRYRAAVTALGVAASFAAFGNKTAPAPNGLELPPDYKNWRVIGISHRLDNNTMRVILGNDAAVAAARGGKTRPWPNGAILAKVVWKQTVNANWDKAIEAGDFVHTEIMVKDDKRFAATGGWGYARWKGADLKPYGNDTNFAAECVACHTPVKHQDYVFTRPVVMP
jgi:hypothetical protein